MGSNLRLVSSLTNTSLVPTKKDETKMKTIISETTRPNGAKITLSLREEYSSPLTTRIYIVEILNNPNDTRFYRNYNDAVNYHNDLVKKENIKGGK